MNFQYAQRVEVISGFYKGLKGVVTRIEQHPSYDSEWNNYYVEMEGLIGQEMHIVSEWILENNLKEIK